MATVLPSVGATQELVTSPISLPSRTSFSPEGGGTTDSTMSPINFQFTSVRKSWSEPEAAGT